MSFYFPCKRKKMLSALNKLGFDVKERAKHTKAECIENGKKTTIPRQTDIKREIVDSICKFLLEKEFEEQKIIDLIK